MKGPLIFFVLLIQGVAFVWSDCPAGQYNNTEICVSCEDGYYCPGAESDKIACSPGYKCPAGGSEPQLCARGWYQTSGTQSTCNECTAGSKCPDVTSGPTACPAGSYQPNTGMDNCVNCPPGTYVTASGQQSCVDCPAGQLCRVVSSAPTDCSPGYFSLLGQADCSVCAVGMYSASAASVCTICPAGQKCFDGSGNYLAPPQDCIAGTYSGLGEMICKSCVSGYYSSTRAESCTQCRAGYQCTSTAETGCSAGTYSRAGSTACTTCPAGYHCPANSASPIACPAGKYSATNQNTCSDCTIGHYCAVATQVPKPCPSGTYSTAGSTTCFPCSAGKQCTNGVLSSCPSGTYSTYASGECQSCPVGSACADSSLPPVPCSPGTTTNGLSNQTLCQTCVAGKFCSSPTTTPQPCPSGYFSSAGSTSCSQCPEGFKCPSADASPVACPSGTYSTAGQVACTGCPAGKACPSPTSPATMITCLAGTYAVANQSTCTSCPAAKYCPSTSASTESDCATGEYSLGGLSACKRCEAGFKCPSKDGSDRAPCTSGQYSTGGATSCTDCTAGNYCPSIYFNSSTACPDGFYSEAKATTCTPCPAGKSCASTSSSTSNDCADGSFSVEGQSSCTSCAAGYRCPNKFVDQQIPCTPGYFSTGSATVCTICPAGSACRLANTTGTDCGSGNYSGPGETACTRCPAGSKCASTSGIPEKCPVGQYSGPESATCTDCSAGYYCTGGATSATPSDQQCPWGYYCTGGTNKTPCPKGKYGSKLGATVDTDCLACPQGYYCPEATPGPPGNDLKCPMGSYCPASTDDYKKTLCAAGKYYDKLGAVQSSECKSCPSGTYCPAGSVTPTKCPAGSYCLSDVGSPTKCDPGKYSTEEGATSSAECKGCPAGHYCAQGTVNPTQCPPGTFNSRIDQQTLAACSSCPAGFACTKYGLDGYDSPCMPGYYCPGGNHLPNQTEYACPAGTFTDFKNLTHAAQCTQCPAGVACLIGTGGTQKSPVPCAAGHYCPKGTGSPTQFPCPAGSYSNLTNLEAATECYACPKGKYCLQGSTEPTADCPKGHVCPPSTAYGTQHPCYAGTYNNLTGIPHWDNCLDCTIGHYCPAGSVLPTACLAGFYNPDTKGQSTTSCLDCTAGYYCPTTATVTPLPCGKGNYSDSKATECLGCAPGYYCDQNATSKAFMMSDLVCPAGLECPGNMSAMPNLISNPCRTGYYCPRGDVNPLPVPCPNGTYNKAFGMKQVSDCQQCSPGFYCVPEGLSEPAGECPGGYYCPLGTADPNSFPCPIGFYRNGSAKESSQDCAQCPSGFYCDERGLAIPKDCPRGYYCTEKTIVPEKCPMGYFGNSTNARRDVECTPCPGGKYCAGRGQTEPTGLCDPGFYCREKAFTSSPPEGTTGGLCPAGGYCPEGSAAPTACSVGKYAPSSGAKSAIECVDCAPGYYCAGSNTDLNTKCAAGYYCTGGASTPNQHTVRPGYYSLEGAFAEIPCPTGTYQSAQASPSCIDCSEGYYCNTTAMVAQLTCPAGYYCGTKTVIPDPCPIGTFNEKTFQKAVTQCVQCTPGKACTVAGLAAPDKECFGGYSCKLGAITDKPTNETYGQPCKLGHYCPTGTADGSEKPCKNGTFSNTTGLMNETQCTACTPGSYCTGLGLKEPTGNCSAGYFCVGGSTTPKPEDGVQGNLCPSGFYCPEGSATGLNCSDGYYSSTRGNALCLDCPAGSRCVSGTSSAVDPEACPKGMYCLINTGRNPNMCPVGTFNRATAAKTSAACLPCETGYYCFAQGATGFDSSDPSGNRTFVARCNAGYYCMSGVNVGTPDNSTNTGIGYPCPEGHYCLTGTTEPTICVNGTYRNITGGAASSDCFACPRRYYCNNAININPTGLCAAKYFCTGGANSPTPDGSTTYPGGNICPIAKFCVEGTADPAPCPPGTYNNVTGQSECIGCPSGFYCPSGISDYQPYECPAGHYCLNNTGSSNQYPCPVGTFLNSSGHNELSDCMQCTPGQYCGSQALTTPTGLCGPGHYCVQGAKVREPNGYSTYSLDTGCVCPRNTTGDICPRGFFCPEGSFEPQKCKEGFFCELEGLSTNTASGPCSEGYYCSGGASVRNPTDGVSGNVCPMGRYCPSGTGADQPRCPIGTFNNRTGLANSTECLPCTAGSYCSVEGLTEPSGPCRAGYYCPTGSNVSTTHTCTAGYHCPEGSGTPQTCDSGTYQPNPGQASCDACPAGYFCNVANAPITDYTLYPCQAGHYCVNGTPSATHYPCPAGTYSSTTKLESAAACTKCDAGRYCATPGRTTTQGPCTAGFWCMLGASSPTPNDNVTGVICPTGSYCTQGIASPAPCPLGTWSNSTGLQSASECRGCLGGHYCGTTGLSAPQAPCSQRYYCTANATTPTPTDGTTGDVCPVYHYCPVGTKSPIPCADGTYMPNTTAFECVQCVEGYSCLSGVAPVRCTAGFYCPAGTGIVTLGCPPGTFSSSIGLSNVSQCSSCSSGSYCDHYNATAVTSQCSAGYFCKSGASKANPETTSADNDYGPCPTGRYCPVGTGTPRLCPRGTFSNTTHLTHQDNCTQCTYGNYCGAEGLTEPSGPCDAGYFCLRGAQSSNNPTTDLTSGPCPVGHFCKVGTSNPSPCAAGTYTNLTGQASCSSCPVGYYCPSNTSDYSVFPCITGHYCPVNTSSANEHPCPAGTYNNKTHGTDVTACMPCPAGQYCANEGLPNPSGPCDAGWFCLQSAISARPTDVANSTLASGCVCPANATGGICPVGSYCPVGTGNPITCTAGKYCQTTGLPAPTANCTPGYVCVAGSSVPNPSTGECPSGSYCPAGSAVPTACPLGTFLNTTGGRELSDCLSCTPGEYCGGTGLSATSGQCAQGFYCPGGQNTSTPAEYSCPPGHHCPIGTANPISCPSGKYQDLFQQPDCKMCPEGYYCDGTLQNDTVCAHGVQNPLPCITGHFCPNGTGAANSNPCPAGTFNNRTLLKAQSECTQCLPGQYCATAGLNETSGPCDPGFYCTLGASTATPTDNVTGNACTRGSYCVAGTSVPVNCPAGSYGPTTGLKNRGECSACDAGQYCPRAGMISPEGNCSAGYFCVANSTEASPASGRCPVGYYCPQGSGLARQCSPGTFTNVELSSSCETCTAGHYCTNGSHPQTCPQGFYCPNGTGLVWQSCPSGTYGASPGLYELSQCTTCPGGFFCGTENLTTTSGPCEEGYFCRSGSDTARPTGSGHKGDAGFCPAGYYCPVQTTDPFPCPAGSYNNKTKAVRFADCLACPPGYYCDSQNLTSPNGQCDEGFYCINGSTSARPSLATSTGGPCTPGTYCPRGASLAMQCDAGTYTDAGLRSNCTDCPAGYYCETGAPNTTICPRGSYCPYKTHFATQFTCINGTFNNQTGQWNVSACQLCTAGYYCPYTGMAEPAGKCSPGFYCSLGSWMKEPTPVGNNTGLTECQCPATTIGGPCFPGYYCPEGATRPIACDPGKYCANWTLSATMGDCEPGYYCNSTSASSTPTDGITGNLCPRGHYCPQGSSSPQPCALGYFLNRTHAFNQTECIPCTAGSYCPTAGLPEPAGLCQIGSYCPEKSTERRPTDQQCYAGHACPEGSAQMQPCPSGQYQPNPEQGICIICPAGKYCDRSEAISEKQSGVNATSHGVVTPRVCPTGHYCVNGTETNHQYPCAPGTFNNVTGAESSDGCLLCSPGEYCADSGLATPNDKCLPGYYCARGEKFAAPNETTSTGGPCPQGSYCPLGSDTPTPCPNGTFGFRPRLSAEMECTSCTPGEYCPTTGLTSTRGPCAAGFYCSNRSEEANPVGKAYGDECPTGSYCPSGSAQPTRCSAGTYQPQTRRTNSSSCLSCLGGFYCGTDGLANVTAQCDAGSYCPGGATNATFITCPTGNECPVGSVSPSPCLNGTYTNVTGQATCFVCPEGYFCVNRDRADPCLTGYYCPRGTGANLQPCPVGTFNAQLGLKLESECQECTGGQHCPTIGLSATAGNCADGYYCRQGVNVTNPSSTTPHTGDGGECPTGHQCPAGTTEPVPCLPGTYAGSVLMAACLGCPSRSYCPNTTITPVDCPVGHYCPENTTSVNSFPCPAGTFLNTTRAADISECLQCTTGMYCEGTGNVNPDGYCDPGWYCIGGSADKRPLYTGNVTGSGTSNDLLANVTCNPKWDCVCPSFLATRGGLCPPGYYCPEGSKKPVVCTPGMYCSRVGLSAPEGNCTAGYYCNTTSTSPTEMICPTGHYCLEGTGPPYPCPEGTFGNVTGNIALSNCHSCTPGMYCQGLANVVPDNLCDSGYYCPGGQNSSAPADLPCLAGHYCPQGSARSLLCSNGTYAPTVGHSNCLICPEGYYCDATNGTAIISPPPCPQGYYCPSGTGQYTLFPCPAGTYGHAKYLASITNCTQCPGGQFCEGTALLSPSGFCSSGYYCTGGAKISTPVNDGVISSSVFTGNDICPIGFYCPNATSYPIPCPRGTYSTVRQLNASSECTKCPPGRYCNSTALTTSSGVPPCDPGWICTGGSTTPTPTDPNEGYQCPPGFYCEGGAIAPTSCPAGQFNPDYGRANCSFCPAGSQCSNQNMSSPETCAMGYYCPGGGVLPQACPAGTYNNQTGRSSSSSCTSCPPGEYCQGTGNANPTGKCAAGYYCQGGATAIIPTATVSFPNNGECPAGNYCPEGITSPVLCPRGTMRSVSRGENVSDCRPCIGGTYCATPGLTNYTGLCQRGFYCPSNESIISATPSTHVCPKDHYCTEGTAEPKACPPGQSQPSTGQWECILCPAGYYCVSKSAQTPCPPYNFCPAGSSEPTPCLNGTYTLDNATMLRQANDCLPCVTGKYCRAGQIQADCAAGYFCFSGSYNHTPGDSAPTVLGCPTSPLYCAGPCPAGHWCPEGTTVPVACKNETIRVSPGAMNASECLPCPPGYRCIEGDPVAKPCPVGHYCLRGISPTPCPVLTFRNITGGANISDCYPCRAGYYCNVTGISDVTPFPCPPGYYCLEGSAPEVCPAGRMSPDGRSASPTECPLCTAGYYCPSGRINVNGIACDPGYECPTGAAVQQFCRPGHYCNGTTGFPPECWGGYYCPNATITPILCEFPYYCPPAANMTLICPLGSRANNKAGLRIFSNDSCIICPAGTYGNFSDRSTCLQCPPGYYCPAGTGQGDSNPCVEGQYCPAGSQAPNYCAAGTYNPQRLSVSIDACIQCPANYYNSLPGQKACKNCGSSSGSPAGATTCTCTGKFRSFQEDGNCICLGGYIYYNTSGDIVSDSDGPYDCQPQVEEQCNAKQVRDASTRKCIYPATYDCSSYCSGIGDGTGEFKATIGRCECTTVESDQAICDATCRANAPSVKITKNSDGSVSMAVYNPTTQTTTTQTIAGVFGPTGTATATASTSVVNINPFGIKGLLVRSDDVSNLFAPLNNVLTGSTSRRRLLVTLVPDPTPSISNPLICLEKGDVILFRVYINTADRAASNYPIYVKASMYNTNPSFDFSAFENLKYYITKTNVTVNSLAHIFNEPGTYVFSDSQNTAKEMVVVVQKEGASCPADHSRVMAATEKNMNALGVASSTTLNLTPDWGLIWGLLAFLAACIFLLVVAVIVWRPKHAGLMPLYRWKPFYRSLGKSAPVPEFISHDEDAMLAAGIRGEADGASENDLNGKEGKLLEEFNVRVFYDKLEDQNLHLSSQLAQQALDMRQFYDRLCKQNEDLRQLVSDIDYDKLLSAGAASIRSDDGHDISVTAVANEFKRSGFSDRTAELMAALQLLVERLNSGRIPIKQEMIEKSIHGPSSSDAVVISSKGSDLLTTHLTERIRLEKELAASEVSETTKVINDFEKRRQSIVEQQEEKLKKQLDGETSSEAAGRLIQRHAQETENLLKEFDAGRARELASLQARLDKRRQERVNALRKEQAEACQHSNIPKAPDFSTATGKQTLKIEADRIQAVADGEAAEVAHWRGAAAGQDSLKKKSNFHEQLDAIRMMVNEEEAARRADPDAVLRARRLLRQRLKGGKGGDDDMATEEEFEADEQRKREEIDRLMVNLKTQEAKLSEEYASRQQKMNEELFLRHSGRRSKLQQELKEKQEAEMSRLKAQIGSDDGGIAVSALQAQHEAEQWQLAAALKREEAEAIMAINTANANAFQERLGSLISQTLGDKLADNVSPELLERIIDLQRRQGTALEEELAYNRKRQENELRSKLAARRARKHGDIEREAEGLTAKTVLAEQRQQRAVRKEDGAPIDATLVGVSSVKVEPGSKEETALLKSHAKQQEDLQKRHEAQRAAMIKDLEAKEAKELAALASQADIEKQRQTNELRQRQAAEKDSRDLSDEEAEALMAAHRRQMEELVDRLDSQKSRQELALRQRLGKRRAKLLRNLQTRQDAGSKREQLHAEEELDEIRQRHIKDAEQEAMKNGVEENGVEDADRVVAAVLQKRHMDELADLERRYETEKDIMVNEAMDALHKREDKRREQMLERHQKELVALDAKNYSAEEKGRLRQQLMEKQAAELEDLERRMNEEEAFARDAALREWQTKLAKAKLDLRSRHYKEFAHALRQFPSADGAPHPSIEEAEMQAAELQKLKANLDIKQKEEAEKMKEELRKFEEREKERMSQELDRFKQLLDAESNREEDQYNKHLSQLEERKQAIVAQRRQRVNAEKERMSNQGVSEDEQRRILAQFEKETQNMLAKMDAEKLRMQSSLEDRLKRRREQKLQEKKQVVVSEGNDRQREFIEKQEAARAAEAAEKARETSEIVSRPLTATVIQPTFSIDGGKTIINVEQQLDAPTPDVVVVPVQQQEQQLPPSFDATLPLKDEEFVGLLMRSPLYRRVSNIKTRLEELSSQGDMADLADEKEKKWEKDSDWSPVVLSALQPRHFVVYRFGLCVLDVLRRHAEHPEISLLLADKMAPNRGWQRNAYRNSFHYDPYNRHLFIRLERLDQVGEFILVLVHCSTHIKVGDMSDDTRPEFIREFHRALSCVCEDMFFAKWRTQWGNSSATPTSPLNELFKDCDKKEDREDHKVDIVDEVIDLRTLPSTDKDGVEFNKEHIVERLQEYKKYEAVHKLVNQLGSVEDQMSLAEQQGTKSSNSRVLEGANASDAQWQLSGNSISNLSGHAMFQSFENMVTRRGKQNASKKQEKSRAKTKERQDMIDQLDGQLARLSRKLVDMEGKSNNSKYIEMRRQGIAEKIRELENS